MIILMTHFLQPRLSKHFTGRQPLLRISLQQPRDKVLSVRRDTTPFLQDRQEEQVPNYAYASITIWSYCTVTTTPHKNGHSPTKSQCDDRKCRHTHILPSLWEGAWLTLASKLYSPRRIFSSSIDFQGNRERDQLRVNTQPCQLIGNTHLHVHVHTLY